MISRSMALAVAVAALLPVVLIGCSTPPKAWELPPPPVQASRIVAEGALTRVTLPNGLRVLLLEDRSLPTVSLGLTIRRGIAIEAKGKEGVADLTAEVMRRGAGDRDALAIARAVDELGAQFGAAASWDSMGIMAGGLSRDATTLLELVADVALRPTFDEGEFEKARDEQLAGLKASLDNPSTLLGWQLERTLYPDHRYGVPGSGLPETVGQLALEDVRGFHARLFHPNNAIFYATGDFDSEKLIEQIRVALGSWRPGPVPKPVAAPPGEVPTARKIIVIDRPEMGQVQVAVAHEGLRRSDRRRIGASLLNGVLGGSGFSSRLMLKLRSERGLTYSIHSGFVLRRHPGRFGIATFTRADQAREAIDLLLAEVEAIRSTNPVTEQELINTKAFSVGQFSLGLETSAAVMGSLVNLEVYDLPRDSLDTFRARIQAVTREDVAKLAGELLHPSRAAIVIVGPAKVLLPKLKGLGEIQTVEW